MKRMGQKRDAWTFEEVALFKKQAGGTVGSKTSRDFCKVVSRSEKRAERSRNRLELLNHE